MKEHLPLRYFVVTFAWAWLIEIPLALAGFGYIQIGKELLKVIALPATIVATFGPAAGVFYSLHTLNGKGSIKKYLKNLCDLRLGWKAWLIPIIVLGASTYVAWVVPELWGEPRLKMLLPSLWAFPLYLLIMIFSEADRKSWVGAVIFLIQWKNVWVHGLAIFCLVSFGRFGIFHCGSSPFLASLNHILILQDLPYRQLGIPTFLLGSARLRANVPWLVS